MENDTIFALATARGRAGVAIVRLSGPASRQVLERFCRSVPAVRKLGRRTLAYQNVPLDDALVVWFAKGKSFTGEEVAEIHLHGGVATVTAVLRALSDLPDVRAAGPGEFTRRAFENGQMDLSEVEGLADLIDAETEGQRRQAMRMLSGHLGQRAAVWRAQLIRAMALLEATIDFADEDVPVDVGPEVRVILSDLLLTLRGEVAAGRVAEHIRDGFEVAIVGPPNVGKSTLLNALAGREAAITSSVAGTTRDVIEVRLDIGGLAVTVLDTAGLRDSVDSLENMGIQRGLARAEAADLRIFMTQDGVVEQDFLAPRVQDIVVVAKADLLPERPFAVSGLTGQGIGALIEAVQDRLAGVLASDGVLIRERHRIAVTSAVCSIESAIEALSDSAHQVEMIVEDVRRAVNALDVLVGRIGVEEFLGEIFSSFCIGK